MEWLEICARDAPLILCFPHTGTDIPPEIEVTLASSWLARKDCDWSVEQLYDFACQLGATTIRTAISRTVIDVNRDPSGRSLYPGQNTTELCPTMSFDGEPLYRNGLEPDADEIAQRKSIWFMPYHAAVQRQIDRLRACHPKIVLLDAHSIRSRVPRLFEGELPHINIGTNSSVSCSSALVAEIVRICMASTFTHVSDGRFKGGWTTRHYGKPTAEVHAVQIELAQRGYLDEPKGELNTGNWPIAYDTSYAAPMQAVVMRIAQACLDFSQS